MVRWEVRLRMGAGGGVKQIVVLDGATYFTLVVAYIPTSTAAAMGAMSGALVKKRL